MAYFTSESDIIKLMYFMFITGSSSFILGFIAGIMAAVNLGTLNKDCVYPASSNTVSLDLSNSAARKLGYPDYVQLYHDCTGIWPKPGPVVVVQHPDRGGHSGYDENIHTYFNNKKSDYYIKERGVTDAKQKIIDQFNTKYHQNLQDHYQNILPERAKAHEGMKIAKEIGIAAGVCLALCIIAWVVLKYETRSPSYSDRDEPLGYGENLKFR